MTICFILLIVGGGWGTIENHEKVAIATNNIASQPINTRIIQINVKKHHELSRFVPFGPLRHVTHRHFHNLLRAIYRCGTIDKAWLCQCACGSSWRIYTTVISGSWRIHSSETVFIGHFSMSTAFFFFFFATIWRISELHVVVALSRSPTPYKYF